MTQVFNPAAELAIHIGIQTNKGKAEIETHPLKAETEANNCSM